jgi:hypothetical protein
LLEQVRVSGVLFGERYRKRHHQQADAREREQRSVPAEM